MQELEFMVLGSPIPFFIAALGMMLLLISLFLKTLPKVILFVVSLSMLLGGSFYFYKGNYSPIPQSGDVLIQIIKQDLRKISFSQDFSLKHIDNRINLLPTKLQLAGIDVSPTLQKSFNEKLWNVMGKDGIITMLEFRLLIRSLSQSMPNRAKEALIRDMQQRRY